MFERVVVGVRDEEIGGDAVALAKALMSPDGRLTLLHVHLVTSRPAPDSGAVGDAAKHRYALERLSVLAREFAVDAELACEDARSVRRGLQEFAARHQADLLVVGASHLDDLARDLTGDNTQEVLVEAPCPVAVAPIGYATRGSALTNIGVAYDGSTEAERALALARELAAEREAAVSAFEAVEPPFYIQRDPWTVQDREIDEHVAAVRRRVGGLGGLDAGAEFGDAAPMLARYEESVDLLVIGSHRFRPIDRLLRATTAQRLADEPASPLLVLPDLAGSARHG